jgi:predicted phosphodiesterase
VRYAVVSDVHSNHEALSAVLEAAEDLGAESFLFLGDLVGYNADPDRCAEALASKPVAASVRGNHDKAVCGLMDLQWFNPWARAAAEWTRNNASASTLARVAALPRGPMPVGGHILICHGAPMDEDRYLLTEKAVLDSFRCLEAEYPQVRVCFFGHTHRAGVRCGSGQAARQGTQIELEPDRRYLINPGSVGQPRDGNSGASFGIFDSERFTYANFRIAYDVAAVQRKVLAAGLPTALAQRLSRGE